MIHKQRFTTIFIGGYKFAGKHTKLATSCFYPTENKITFLLWASSNEIARVHSIYDLIINHVHFV